MKKRSAILMAAGLSLAIVTAAFGIVMGFTGPSEAGGKVAISTPHRKPVVKTVTERHTVHMPTPGGDGGSTTVISRTPAPETTVASEDAGDDTQTSHDSEDDSFEHETESPEPTETHSESESPESERDD